MLTFAREFAQDARYTFRQLRHAPFYSVTVLLTLALAIGAATAMARVMRATLLHPLPYPHLSPDCDARLHLQPPAVHPGAARRPKGPQPARLSGQLLYERCARRRPGCARTRRSQALLKHRPFLLQRRQADARRPRTASLYGDVQGTGGTLAAPPGPEVYHPNSAWPHMQFALRTGLPVGQIEPAVRRLVTGMDSTASVGHFAPLSSSIDRTLSQPRLNASLLTAFAGLSLLLVAIGVYALVAFDVAQRTRELGLRLALGSTRVGVLRLLLGESARILAVGLALGIAGSLAASRLLAAAIAGAQSKPVVLLLGSVAVLVVAVLAVTLLPAARAAAGDPMQALRAE